MAESPSPYTELFGAHHIQKGIKQLADNLISRFDGRLPPMVALLNGARPFARDLGAAFTRRRVAHRIHEIRAGRYDRNNNPTDTLQVDMDALENAGLHGAPFVLKLDDVLDEGGTDVEFTDILQTQFGVQQTELAVVVDKLWTPEDPRPYPSEAHFSVFTTPHDDWLVGYGMDDAGEHRDLPWIGRKVQ
jgi:hypoxanthine-guanine phosphoribosyltransferase